MLFAFHLLGDHIDEFADLVKVPCACFYPPTATPSNSAGVYLPTGIPAPAWAEAVQHVNNETKIPLGMNYLLYYGDVRSIRGDGRIPVVCDIMDNSFWFYLNVLRKSPAFTFSVNTTLCDPIVFQKTVEMITQVCSPVSYEVLA